MARRPEPPRTEVVARDPSPTRPLEDWELAELREYWPDVKKMTISYRFFNWLMHGMVRVFIISATVFTAVWGMRDVIERVIKAILSP